jgi:hypothetical protein
MNERTQSKTNIQSQNPVAGFQQSEEGMHINGLEQVVQMLRHADPAFRDSLIRRLTQRDPSLAQKLKRIIR